MKIEDKNNEKSLGTYLPYSENFLASKFLANQDSVNTFIRLVKEYHFLPPVNSYRKPITQIISDMPGLTEEQKNKTIKAAKGLENQPIRKKLECQF